MSEEIKTVLEISAFVLAGAAGLVTIGIKFGWKHKEILDRISTVKTMLETHIKDEGVVFERIERKIKKIETAVNGKQ
jgi:hypothetical protein